MPGEVVVFVTCPPADAEKIASQIVDEKLAACVSILPQIKSIYRWKGETMNEAESLLMVKSHKAYWQRLRARLKELHSYDVPEIICLPIEDGDVAYLDWIRSQLEGALC